jgi:hypothetical protein
MDEQRQHSEKDPKTGRFLKGCKGGPGRTPKHTVFQTQWDKMFGVNEFRRAAWKLYELCLAGDQQMLKYFMDRCMGKIVEQLRVTNVNESIFDKLKDAEEELSNG